MLILEIAGGILAALVVVVIALAIIDRMVE